MKIQSMTIIFIIIILPISLVLSIYIQNQVKTLKNQIGYDSKLYTATYDAIKAFQLNTQNSTTSDIAASKIRDIEASVNTFYNSIQSNFNLNGYGKDAIQEFIPALVYTMYDGYYIYGPYNNVANYVSENDTVEVNNISSNSANTYGLKPYVHYSCKYVTDNSDFVITYSLDNYIKIQGMINGNYINDEGYIIDYMNVEEDGSKYRGYSITDNSKMQYASNDDKQQYTYIKKGGVKYYKDSDSTDNNPHIFYILNGKKLDFYGETAQSYISNINIEAQNYYKQAKEFTERLVGYGLSNLEICNAYMLDSEGNYQSLNFNDHTQIFAEINNDVISGETTIVEPNSVFNQHRREVIKKSIETNLSAAIAAYNNYSNAGTNFQMPKLKEIDWDLLLNNICMISFMQGMNIGGKLYNGYCVIPNNKNKEVVTENSIYIVSGQEYYQIMDETLLSKTELIGYFNIDFEPTAIVNNDELKYYLPRKEQGSYTSVIGGTGISKNWDGNVYKYLQSCGNTDLASAYYTALGRERYGLKNWD